MSSFTLIKNEKLKVIAGNQVLKADEYVTVLEAQQLVERVAEEAQKIIDDANAVYKSEKKRGYQDGCHEGKAAQAEKMMTATIAAVHYFSAVENKLVDIVMSATNKILSQFDDIELTKGIVRQALDKVRNESKITLRVCPQHVATIRTQLREITADYSNIGFIDVVADSRIDAAACKVETEMGSVDTSMDKQLQALRTALANNFGEPPDISE